MTAVRLRRVGWYVTGRDLDPQPSIALGTAYAQTDDRPIPRMPAKQELPDDDRAFLREVATRVWAFDGTRLVDFDGGEPTLHAGLGEIIRGAHALTELPVVVIFASAFPGLEEMTDEITRHERDSAQQDVLRDVDERRAEEGPRARRRDAAVGRTDVPGAARLAADRKDGGRRRDPGRRSQYGRIRL
mgnify:CR=1 FL=1